MQPHPTTSSPTSSHRSFYQGFQPNRAELQITCTPPAYNSAYNFLSITFTIASFSRDVNIPPPKAIDVFNDIVMALCFLYYEYFEFSEIIITDDYLTVTIKVYYKTSLNRKEIETFKATAQNIYKGIVKLSEILMSNRSLFLANTHAKYPILTRLKEKLDALLLSSCEVLEKPQMCLVGDPLCWYNGPQPLKHKLKEEKKKEESSSAADDDDEW